MRFLRPGCPLPLLALLGGTVFMAAPAAQAAGNDRWAAAALAKEADYLVDCSFTEYARHHQEVQTADDAYGAVNLNRIYQRGPDWVSPGEAAMGVIGLMAAARQLRIEGHEIGRYEAVLDRFFLTWLLARRQPVDMRPGGAADGGVLARVSYTATGKRQGQISARTGVTGQMIAAMWKYAEHRRALDDAPGARAWLQQSWPLARRMGDFLRRNYDARYHLLRPNAETADLWVSDSSYGAAALRCLDRWAVAVEQPKAFDYAGMAAEIAVGLKALKDHGAWKNFRRYRDSKTQTYAPTYGDRIDQIGFVPYEADVLDPGEPYARSISDWWTNGAGGVRMTLQTTDAHDWRYFGTRWRWFFLGSGKNQEANRNLYPGPSLQLAKVEWKHARRTGDAVTLERARRRLQWASGTAYANLWLGAPGSPEAQVSGGLVDWRDGALYPHKAEDWARFVDTSAYFIEAVLMLEYDVDTKYVPE